jgi:hypothetical protein
MAAAEGAEGMIPWELDSEVSARREAEFVLRFGPDSHIAASHRLLYKTQFRNSHSVTSRLPPPTFLTLFESWNALGSSILVLISYPSTFLISGFFINELAVVSRDGTVLYQVSFV